MSPSPHDGLLNSPDKIFDKMEVLLQEVTRSLEKVLNMRKKCGENYLELVEVFNCDMVKMVVENTKGGDKENLHCFSQEEKENNI